MLERGRSRAPARIDQETPVSAGPRCSGHERAAGLTGRDFDGFFACSEAYRLRTVSNGIPWGSSYRSARTNQKAKPPVL